ncbi:unnamed protein product [Pylaiella littoralis]
MDRIGRTALLLACIASLVRRTYLEVAAWTHAVSPTRASLLVDSRSVRGKRKADRALPLWGGRLEQSVGGAAGGGWRTGRRGRSREQGSGGGGGGAGHGDVFCCFSAASNKRQNSRPVGTDELTQAAKDRATALIGAYVSTPATEGDLRCIEERQLRHKAGASSRSVAVSPSPCRHGFPQAFAFDPCGHKVSSGLFRLSCPWLVQAIDQLEDEGGIEDVNSRLAIDEDLREDFMAVNLAHAQLRRRLVTPDRMRMVEETIGKQGAERFLDSGITGVTPGKVRDAKCLHAHTADALMRGRDANAIGRATLELLEARGVRTDGGDQCSEQCNYRVEETADSWRYTPQKNKQRLQTKKLRRKSMKSPDTKNAKERQDRGIFVAVDGEGGITNGGNSGRSDESRDNIGV